MPASRMSERSQGSQGSLSVPLGCRASERDVHVFGRAAASAERRSAELRKSQRELQQVRWRQDELVMEGRGRRQEQWE